MNENFKKYLPLGSVVLMKDAKKRVMITGYAVKAPESGDRLWDYIGCLWPEGMIAPDKNLLFDHNDIHQIFAVGYTDEEQKRFMEVLNKATVLKEQRENKENGVTPENVSVSVNSEVAPTQNVVSSSNNEVTSMESVVPTQNPVVAPLDNLNVIPQNSNNVE